MADADLNIVCSQMKVKKEEAKIILNNVSKTKQQQYTYSSEQRNSSCEFDFPDGFGLPTSRTKTKRTGYFLHKAIAEQKWDTVAVLLKHDANVIVKNDQGETPLSLAVTKCQDESLLAKLSSGVSLNSKNKFGYTALYTAVASCNWPAARFLLNKGANVDIVPDMACDNCLTLALKPDMMMFDGEAPPNDVLNQLITPTSAMFQDGEENFPLTLACFYGCWAAIPKLVEVGIAPDDPDLIRPALITAMKSLEDIPVEYMKYLITGDVNEHEDYKGNRALHEACDGGKWDCVRELLKAGADVNVLNDRGQSPLCKWIPNSSLAHMPLDIIPDLIPDDFERVLAVLMSLIHSNDPVPEDQILCFLQHMPTPADLYKIVFYEDSDTMYGFMLNDCETEYGCEDMLDSDGMAQHIDWLIFLITETCFMNIHNAMHAHERHRRYQGFRKTTSKELKQSLTRNYRILEEESEKPRSLKKLAVFKARENMSDKSSEAFDRLGVPSMIKRMIKFEDVGRALINVLEESS